MIAAADAFVGDIARGIALVERGFEQVTRDPEFWDEDTVKSIFASLAETIEAGERHIPRLTILFPATSWPTMVIPSTPAFRALLALNAAKIAVEAARAGRIAVPKARADEIHSEVWQAHGAFAFYAHQIISRRRPDRPPSPVERRRIGKRTRNRKQAKLPDSPRWHRGPMRR